MGDHPELETESRREGGKGKQRVRGARWWVFYHQAKAPGACPSARLTLSRFHPAQGGWSVTLPCDGEMRASKSLIAEMRSSSRPWTAS